jgi:toxin YhaV
MSSSKPVPLLIHGWTVFAHPQFLAQLEALAQQVEALKQKDPVGYVKKNATKRLAAITKLAFDVIPQDPTRSEYRQGNTLGDEHKHWFRAKFFQQYRLFFRYHAPSKVIVFAWVNDEDTKRAYDSSDDAYRELAGRSSAQDDVREVRELSARSGGHSRGWKFDRQEIHERS